MKRTLSLIMPAYNEGKLLDGAVKNYHQYLNSLEKNKRLESFEIIICVNGSTDNTEKVAESLSKTLKHVGYLVTEKKGIGVAIRLGILKSTKDIIAYLPGDGEFGADFLKSGLNAMNDKTLVIGSRRTGAEYRGKTLFRKFLSYGLNILTAVCLSKKVSEAFSIKMYDAKWAKSIVNKLKENGFASQTELVYFALKDKLNIKSVPVTILHRKNLAQSSVKIFHTVWSTFKVTVKYGLKYRIEQIKGLF